MRKMRKLLNFVKKTNHQRPWRIKIVVLVGFSIGVLLSLPSAVPQQEEDKTTPPVEQVSPKYIYLTFDDGPLRGSQRINDAVRSEKIPITVMLVGAHALVRPKEVALYKENEYIEVGNHSYSHANNHYQQYYSHPEGVLLDFKRSMDTLRLTDKIGRLPGRNMWRIGGRSKNDISSGIEAADLLHQHGFSLFGWDLEWMHNTHTAAPMGLQRRLLSKSIIS